MIKKTVVCMNREGSIFNGISEVLSLPHNVVFHGVTSLQFVSYTIDSIPVNHVKGDSQFSPAGSKVPTKSRSVGKKDETCMEW